MTNMAKVDKPPTAENWARMQHPDVNRTAKAIFNFLKGAPSWNYNPARSGAKYRIEDRITREMVLEVVRRSKNKIGRPFNIELIEAFLRYEESSPIDGVLAFDNFSEWFPLNRSVRIPVKPLTVIKENGAFSPIFLCPWSKVSFDHYQARLLMSILEEAIFRHSDFDDGIGKVLFFPKVAGEGGVQTRKPMVWTRGQFELLSRSEMNDQVSIFFESKKKAGLLYQDYLNSKGK